MKYKTTQKDRYGNMRSLEIDTGEKNMEVPPMTSGIPQYEAVGGLAENHPGGPKGSDTVPAWLTPGEFVVNKEAVDMYGPQIKKMNDAGRAVQDGNMNPNQAPPVYADAGIEVPKSKPLRLAFEHQYGSTLEDWKNWLKEREGGFRSDVYSGARDSKVWEPTTGFGHLLPVSKYSFEKYGQGGVQGPFADEAAANEQFEEDFAIALAAAQRNVGTDTWRELQPQQQFALANMAYQMGQTRQAGLSKTMDAVKAGDWKEAQRQAQYNFFANNPDKIHSYTAWANPNTGTPERVKDFQAFIQAFPEVATEVETPTNMPNPLEAAQDGWRSMRDTLSNILGNSVQETNSTANINEAGGTPHSLIPMPELPVSKPKPEVFNYDKPLKKRGMQEGGVVHAFMGQEVPRYLTDLQDNELEGYLNSQVIPYAENLVAGGDGDDLGHVPYTTPPAADIPVSDWNADPNKLNPPALPVEQPIVDSGFNDMEYYQNIPYRYPVDYPEVGSTQSTPPPAPVPSGVDHGFQQALKGKILNQVDSYDPQGLGGEEGEQPIIDTGWNPWDHEAAMTHKYGYGYDGLPAGYVGKPTYTNMYDKYVQEELTGTPYSWTDTPLPPDIPVSDWNADPNKITPPMPVVPPSGGPPAGAYIGSPSSPGLGLDPDAYDQETGDLLLPPPGSEAEAASMIGVKPDMSENDVLMSLDLEQQSGATKNAILSIQGQLESAYKDLKAYQLSGGDNEGEVLFRDKIRNLENQLDSFTKKQALIDFRNKVAPDIEASKQKIKDDNKIISLQQIIDSKETTEIEKIKAAQEIADLGGETTEQKAEKAANEKLNNLAKNIDGNLVDAMNDSLNSAEGKKAIDDASKKNDDDPEKSKARKMFDFLFGDLIDQGEIGRAIAVYLGSRALGYDHGNSISYVAKQYITRIDKKNAAFKKWMLANTGKYTSASIEKFKRTGNPNHLIPIGAKPRSQGNSKMMYHKGLNSEGMAYEFKVKNSQGEDETFWSFDPTGQNDKLRIGTGWTDKNVLDVGTEEINLIEKMLTGFQTKWDKEVTGKKDNKRTKFWSSGTDVPGLIPAAAAGEVAQWLHERDIPPGEYQTAIANAYKMLVDSNKFKVKELGDKAVLESSLIPFLQESTVKVRLEDLSFINEKGKAELIPSPAVALLDGKKRVMDTKLLVDLENRIDLAFPKGTADRFWAFAAKEWKKDSKVRKEYIATAKTKDFKDYTPFALWAEFLLQSEIKRAAKQTAQ